MVDDIMYQMDFVQLNDCSRRSENNWDEGMVVGAVNKQKHRTKIGYLDKDLGFMRSLNEEKKTKKGGIDY